MGKSVIFSIEVKAKFPVYIFWKNTFLPTKVYKMITSLRLALQRIIRSILGPMHTEQLKRAIAIAKKPSSASLSLGFSVNPNWELKQFSIKDHEVFFGYYDKRQLSLDGNRLLACVVSSDFQHMHEPSGEMEVGWFDVNHGNFCRVASTSAYNWQQGCMLRWVPNTGDQLITFNDYRHESFVTVVVDANNGALVAERPYATYDFAPSGKFIASCNFSRLHKYRPGYGYWQDYNNHAFSAEREVVNIFDARTDSLIRSISFEDISRTIGCNFSSDHAYVNHLSFSPNSEKLIFLVFWNRNLTKHMAALIYDLSHDKIQIMTKQYLSHFCWASADNIVAWGSDPYGKQGYFSYDLLSGQQSAYWIGDELSDGHCSIQNDGTMLTDTYPDAQGFQSLMIRSRNGNVINLASLHSPARLMFDLRCDLHPRLTHISDCYSFDSACGGNRSTYLIKRRNALH